MLTFALAIAGFAAAGALIRSARRVDGVARVGALRGRSRRRLPARLRAAIERRLAAAALGYTPEAAVQAWLLAAAVTALSSVLLAPVVAPAATLLALAAGPVGLHLARHRSDRIAAESVPEILERVSSELRGGSALDGAIEAAASAGGPLASDLRRVRERVSLGASLGEALSGWAAERDVPGVRETAGSLAVAARAGGPAAGALDGLAASLRDRKGAHDEARALSTQARLSAVVVGAGPIAYLALSALIDPSAVARTFSNPLAQACLAAGLVLEASGALWMRHLLRAIA